MHYLALLEHKSRALDQAAPLVGWPLPECFAELRRLLEARLRKHAGREYIQILRLLESFALAEVTAAVKDALRLGALSFDAVRHLVLCHIEHRPPRMDMENWPHLPVTTVRPEQAHLRLLGSQSVLGLSIVAVPISISVAVVLAVVVASALIIVAASGDLAVVAVLVASLVRLPIHPPVLVFIAVAGSVAAVGVLVIVILSSTETAACLSVFHAIVHTVLPACLEGGVALALPTLLAHAVTVIVPIAVSISVAITLIAVVIPILICASVTLIAVLVAVAVPIVVTIHLPLRMVAVRLRILLRMSNAVGSKQRANCERQRQAARSKTPMHGLQTPLTKFFSGVLCQMQLKVAPLAPSVPARFLLLLQPDRRFVMEDAPLAGYQRSVPTIRFEAKKPAEVSRRNLLKRLRVVERKVVALPGIEPGFED